MITVGDVLKTLASWATEPHDSVCKQLKEGDGGPCRHERASLAVVEINNAVADLEKRQPSEKGK